MPHPKFKYLVPHTKEWRELRRSELTRRKMIGADGCERLTPGPVPDPDLERSLNRLSSCVTDRELKAFMRLKPKKWTPSMFLRFIVCSHLESRRMKTMPTKSFLDWVEKQPR